GDVNYNDGNTCSLINWDGSAQHFLHFDPGCGTRGVARRSWYGSGAIVAEPKNEVDTVPRGVWIARVRALKLILRRCPDVSVVVALNFNRDFGVWNEGDEICTLVSHHVTFRFNSNIEASKSILD